MKLTIEQANALLAVEPFIVVNVWCERTVYDTGDPGDYDDDYTVSIAATNINSEHGMADLLEHLRDEPYNEIDGIEPGYSVYLCHMRFEESKPGASYDRDGFMNVYESDPYWEVESYERTNFVSQEEMLKGEE